MAQTRVVSEIRPPERPPEASQPGPVVWLKKNLFSSAGNSIVSVIMLGVVVVALRAVFSFLFAEERLWGVIPRNSANYAIGTYPRANLFRMWLSLGVVSSLVGLATAVWMPRGRVAPARLAIAVRSVGASALVLGVLAPPSFGARGVALVAGVVLLVGGHGAVLLLGDRRRDRSIPTLTVVAAVLVLFLVVLWLLPVATTTKLPWTLTVVAALAFFGVGRLLVSAFGTGRMKPIASGLAILALPVIYMHIQRAPQVPWSRVADWAPWLVGLLIAGYLVVAFVSTTGRERAAVVNAVLVVVAIVVWFFDMPMVVRFLLLLLAALSLATPTFASGESGRRNVVVAWTVLFAITVYLFVLGVASPGLDTNSEYFGGLNLTFMLAVIPMLAAFPIGILMALGRTSTMPIFRLLSTGYIELIRGVPLITVLIFFRFGIPNFLRPGENPAGVVLVLIGITLFAAAYLAENVRGGLQSIPAGQYEAAKAMGMTTAQMTMLITLPQALRAVIPAVVGQIITLFKDTSLAAIVGIAEFLRIANNLVPSQPDSLGSKLENLVLAAAVYWVFTFTFSRASQRLERRLGIGTR